MTDDINRLAEWLAELKNQELLEQAARLKEQTDIVRLLYQIYADFSQNAAAQRMEQILQPMVKALDAHRIEFHRRHAMTTATKPRRQPQPLAFTPMAPPTFSASIYRCVLASGYMENAPFGLPVGDSRCQMNLANCCMRLAGTSAWRLRELNWVRNPICFRGCASVPTLPMNA